MILTCPACSTRFLVPDAAFAGRASRRVRCGRCRHEWQAAAPAGQTGASRPADFASLITEPHQPQELAPAVPPQPIPPGSNLPVRIRRKWLSRLTGGSRPRRNIALLALALILLLVGLAALAPAGLAGLGTLVRGTFAMQNAPRLTIETVTTRYLPQTAAAAETGATAPDALGTAQPTGWSLVVEGVIRNQSDGEETIPPLRLLTKDAHGALLGTYHPAVQARTLPPHGETGFTMQLGAADPKLAEVTVEFGGQHAAD